ncbi:PhzF family phenazine biosynthesis protein [Rhodovibrionaceae bacterium A322]
MNENHEKSRSIEAHVVNGFVQQGHGGNPAGVVLNADGLNDADMLSIAAQVGLSETAFVSQSKTEGFKLDFFTPNRRIAHCGHATIATFSYLAQEGVVQEGWTSKETVDGPRKILIKKDMAFMEQLAPRYRSAADWEKNDVTLADVLRSLGLSHADLDPALMPELVNTGNSFIVVSVKDSETLRSIQPDLTAITAISEKLDLIGYYVISRSPEGADSHATTRMFAPRYAIAEESATGMAAGPLACLLYDRAGLRLDTMVIEQGHFMTPPSPSVITVELSLEQGKITGLMAGGQGKVMRSLEVTL